MQTAEIVERAGAGERKGIRVIGVERLGSKGCFLLDYRMRNVVMIDPLHRRSHRHRQLLGREREVIDGDHVRGVLRRYRTERQHRSNHWTQKHYDDQGTG